MSRNRNHLSNRRGNSRGKATSRGRDPRFLQLLHKARGGDEDAVGDLWREFDFDYEQEGGRDDLD